MTNEEKNQLVTAVISQLKSEGTDIANAEVIEDTSGVPFVIGYKADGSLVRVNAENIANNKNITWNNDTNPSDMNDFVVAGVYNIQGERTRSNDNLPILNTGGGNTFDARLTVLDSSISGNGKDDDKCITQILSFSNRLGQGEVYIRTGKGNSLSNLTWEAWSTLQRNVNVVADTYDNLTDNGIYSGVANTTNEMFVLVVINNYALATPKGAQRSISQFKYSVNTGGSVALNKRVKVGDNDWSAWEILNKEESDANVAELVKRLQGTSKDSSPSKDPFKHLGVFTDINGSEFKTALNSLHTTNPQDNIMGLWRAEANSNVIEIQCVAILYAKDKWMQVLKSPFKYIKSADAFSIVDNPRYRIIYRFFENNAWGDWVDVEQDLEDSLKTNADNITNEITRAKAEETAIRKLISDLVGESPATLDTIHEISSWILNDKTGAAAMATRINQNTSAIQLNHQDITDLQVNKADKSDAMQYDTLGVNVYANKAEIYGRSINGTPRTFEFPAATTKNAGVMIADDKAKIDRLAVVGTSVNLNEYTNDGVYYIHIKDEAYNYPILTPKDSVARLTVVGSHDGNTTVITQVLNLNNNAGGEGNIYIRAKQGDSWGAWGKLQTNIEVNAIGLGQSKTFDDLTDNGIYSGVNVYAVGYDDNGYPIIAYETFVLVVINAYLTGGGVAQLKYSTLLDGTTEVKLRSKVNGVWSNWRGLGGGSADLSNYYTKDEIDNKSFVTTEPTDEEAPDVPDYITRTDLDNAIDNAITNTLNTPV